MITRGLLHFQYGRQAPRCWRMVAALLHRRRQKARLDFPTGFFSDAAEIRRRLGQFRRAFD